MAEPDARHELEPVLQVIALRARDPRGGLELFARARAGSSSASHRMFDRRLIVVRA